MSEMPESPFDAATYNQILGEETAFKGAELLMSSPINSILSTTGGLSFVLAGVLFKLWDGDLSSAKRDVDALVADVKLTPLSAQLLYLQLDAFAQAQLE